MYHTWLNFIWGHVNNSNHVNSRATKRVVSPFREIYQTTLFLFKILVKQGVCIVRVSIFLWNLINDNPNNGVTERYVSPLKEN